MSVEVNTYRFRNTMYGAQGYFAIKETIDPDTNDVIYSGYKNAFSPLQIFPISEITSSALHGTTTGASIIPGDQTHFTDSATWHTPLHIIGGDSTNYMLGCYIWIYEQQLSLNFSFCVWTREDPSNWYTYNRIRVRAPNPLSTNEEMFNLFPEYIYLAGEVNDITTHAFYPYPFRGGYFYFDTDSNIHYSSDNMLAIKLFPVLFAIDSKEEEAPDPEPTPLPNDDPYAPSGGAWTGGGQGDFDTTTDDVEIPGLPTLTASSTGFITLYNPSIGQLQSLCNYMWSGAFDIDTFRKIFADPMQCILGLSIVPVDVPSGGSSEVKVGNISTGISLTKASSQYVEVSCGTVSVKEYSGSYLDYEPYTKAELFLPFVGIHAISIDDIMGKTLGVTYHIDILSGACVAYVTVNGSVLYSFIGQCASSIPITGNDWTNVINGVLNISGAVGSMVATGGMSAPFALGSIASTAVNNMKPSIEKSGSLSGAGGMLGVKTPYLILTRPRLAIPENQNRYMGYPSYITARLGNISGYTEVDSIHLDNISATGAELAEIESILKGGVIL